jgi:hypothetical protein
MVEVLSSSYAYNGVTTIPEDSPVNDVSRVAAAAVAARVLMGSANLENRQMSREEHSAMMQELGKKRAGWRTPRRGWSSTESPAAEPAVPNPTPAVSSPMADNAYHGQLAERHAAHSLASQQHAARRPADAQQQPPQADQHGARPRPPLPPPRRSYSVMDYEPPSATHRPSVRMAITDLPAELHYAIFDFLDPIDSTCLGLTNSHFYTIHRRMHGSVPLSSRRSGPNDLEWAWRGAGPLVHRNPQPTAAAPAAADTDPAAVLAQQRAALPNAQALERLRVKGQVYCRKCGVSRCELHRHLREWMASSGKNLEYCSVSCRYGPQAPEGAKEFCHLRSPKKPHRCGRHASKAGSGTQTPRVLEPQQRA